jgi:hypothetical protein
MTHGQPGRPVDVPPSSTAFLRSTAHEVLSELVHDTLQRDEKLNTFARLNGIDPDEVLSCVLFDRLVEMFQAEDAADVDADLSGGCLDRLLSTSRHMRWEMLVRCVRRSRTTAEGFDTTGGAFNV